VGVPEALNVNRGDNGPSRGLELGLIFLLPRKKRGDKSQNGAFVFFFSFSQPRAGDLTARCPPALQAYRELYTV
jgi:hypothetical protein